MRPVLAFACSVKGAPWGEHHERVVHAHSRGQAKSQYLRDVRDAWPDLPYTAVRCRRVPSPTTTPMLQHVCRLRGVHMRFGDRVHFGSSGRSEIGTVVGSSEGANFELLLDDGSRIFVHPCDIQQIDRLEVQA